MALRALRVRSSCASLLAAGAVLLIGGKNVASQEQQQQQPTFRTATNLVRVDAYPARDGKIILGLTASDFELLEDGVPQKIESFQFVLFPQSNPVEERRDPNSQRDGFQLAADPSYRVFVIYLDNLHVDTGGSHFVRLPLIKFLNQVLGPKDLFGVLTTRQRPEDLMLGQQTLLIEEQLTRYWDWGQGGRVLEDDEDLMIQACFPSEPGVAADLVGRRRLDEVFGDLEGLMTMLASIREERKNIVLVSNGWYLPGRNSSLRARVQPRPPSIGVTNAGKISTGRSGAPGEFDPKICEEQLQRLGDIDFQQRLRELLRVARESNVTMYTIRPTGLVAPGSVRGMNLDNAQVDSLRTLSNNTDGLAVVNTNDLSSGVQRITDDLAAMYLLGYYPSNTKADGRLRRITVKLKETGGNVRARREYRAPTEADVAAMRAAVAASDAAPAAPRPVDVALAEMKRLRPSAVLHSRGTILGDELVLTTELTAPEVEAGRWKAGGDIQVMVSGPGGDVVTSARGRLEPGQRAAVIRVPVSRAPGPFSAAIRLRGETDGDAHDGVVISRPAAALGDPLLFRLATPTQVRPAASVYFRRTERLQARWPVDDAVSEPKARLLGRDGVPLDLPVPVTEREIDGRRVVVADLNLAPLTAGEYVIELEAVRGGATVTSLLAFRVFR